MKTEAENYTEGLEKAVIFLCSTWSATEKWKEDLPLDLKSEPFDPLSKAIIMGYPIVQGLNNQLRLKEVGKLFNKDFNTQGMGPALQMLLDIHKKNEKPREKT